MYEPSRHVMTFDVAGFQFWDGATVVGSIQAGDELELVPEPDNPHDPEAVALRWRGTKLGYVPASQNHLVALLAHFGHGDVLECRVIKADPKLDPWDQVTAAVYVRDAR